MEEEQYFNAETMERLNQKGKLITDTSKVFEELAKRKEVYKTLGWRGKRFMSGAVKTVHKDFKLGLKKINKKIPVYVELPKLKSVGDSGVVSKTYDGETTPSSYEVSDIPKIKHEPLKSDEVLDFTDKNLLT